MIQCIDDDHGSTLTRDMDAGTAVQTNLGGQVALSDSNFVPCPRNLPREPWKMSKLVQATTGTHPFVEQFLQVQIKVINLNDAGGGGSWV